MTIIQKGGKMSDLIERQAAIEIFTQLWDCIGTIMDRDEWEDVCKTTANELPSAQRWIPIEDRPPEFGKDVLISHRGFVSIDWLTQSEGDAYFFASGVAIADIDAWMPLPESYRGE